MRALIGVILVAAGLWAGYWFVGSRAALQAAEAVFANDGPVELERDSLTIAGFPNRFDLTVTGLTASDPATGIRWDSPEVQLYSMSWKPWHLIAALNDPQTVTLPGQIVTLTPQRAIGSLVLVPGTDLTLDRVTVETGGITAASSLGWAVRVDQLMFATRRAATPAFAHDDFAEASGLTPDATLTAALSQAELPPVAEVLRLDCSAAFSAAIDRHAAETAPVLTGITLKEGLLRWGDLTVFAKGDVAPDAEGLAVGRIDIKVTQWRKLVPVLVGAGVFTPEVAPTVTRALELLSQQGADPDVLDVPLLFQSGRMSLGPLPLGVSPRLN